MRYDPTRYTSEVGDATVLPRGRPVVVDRWTTESRRCFSPPADAATVVVKDERPAAVTNETSGETPGVDAAAGVVTNASPVINNGVEAATSASSQTRAPFHNYAVASVNALVPRPVRQVIGDGLELHHPTVAARMARRASPKTRTDENAEKAVRRSVSVGHKVPARSQGSGTSPRRFLTRQRHYVEVASQTEEDPLLVTRANMPPSPRCRQLFTTNMHLCTSCTAVTKSTRQHRFTPDGVEIGPECSSCGGATVQLYTGRAVNQATFSVPVANVIVNDATDDGVSSANIVLAQHRHSEGKRSTSGRRRYSTPTTGSDDKTRAHPALLDSVAECLHIYD